MNVMRMPYGDEHSQSTSAAATEEDEDDLYSFMTVAPRRCKIVLLSVLAHEK